MAHLGRPKGEVYMKYSLAPVAKRRSELLGKEGKKKLYDHLRDAKGRVPVAAFGAAIGELIRSFSAGKNSASSPN